MSHEVRTAPDPQEASLERVTLVSPDGVTAGFVPGAGMVGASLTLDGVELLAQRHGLAGYLERGSTFGLPLLAPWANRLASPHQSVGGTSWDVVAGSPGVHVDEWRQPIHGLVPGAPGWSVVDAGADDAGARLVAAWAFDADHERFASFPFPFRLEVEALLAGGVLRVATRLQASGGAAVPVAFGWHPWFDLAGTPRGDWVLEGPLSRRAVLGATKIPTGDVADDPLPRGALGTTVLDDVYVDVPEGAGVHLRGGSHAVSVRYLSGYPVAVVFAPEELDVVCIEPMTAPTDPFSGRFPLRWAQPDEVVEAVFEIAVERTG